MTPQNRELLELAAKAAGYHFTWNDKHDCAEVWVDGDKIKRFWQPHRDDGDTLRLAVKLELPIHYTYDDCIETGNTRSGFPIREKYDGDPYAATRLAIVRAAAEIGRNMP